MRAPSASLVTVTLAALALTACAGKKDEQAAPPAAETAVDKAGPAIDRSIAPGVAFKFEYAFTLPTKGISAVQRQHADACAKLGASRCRVTGMNYDQHGADNVSARLDFLLAPDIAQSFASDAVAAVEKAEGKLDNASVNGENAGEAIRLSQSDSAGIEAEAKRIEARLAAPGLSASERAELQNQLGTLREQLRGQAQQRGALEQSIATTPVSFSYQSEGLVGGSGTFGKAASASWASLSGMLALLALIGGIALPWLALGAVGLFAWKRLRPKPAPVEPASSK